MDYARLGLIAHGFVELTKGKRRATGREMMRRVKELALHARQHAEFARMGFARSDYYHERGVAVRAKIEVGAALADHRRSCQYLLDLADTCRALVNWAALDWVPLEGVEGTGLTPVELRRLMFIAGGETDASTSR